MDTYVCILYISLCSSESRVASAVRDRPTGHMNNKPSLPFFCIVYLFSFMFFAASCATKSRRATPSLKRHWQCGSDCFFSAVASSRGIVQVRRHRLVFDAEDRTPSTPGVVFWHPLRVLARGLAIRVGAMPRLSIGSSLREKPGTDDSCVAPLRRVPQLVKPWVQTAAVSGSLRIVEINGRLLAHFNVCGSAPLPLRVVIMSHFHLQANA